MAAEQIKSSAGKAQASASRPGAFTNGGAATPAPPTCDDRESGDKEVSLLTFAPGSNITRAEVEVKGKAFCGKLEFLRGAKVMLSPVVYNADGIAVPPAGNERAFIVDFTGIRSLLSLDIPEGQGSINLVLSWMGTEFNPKALYGAAITAGGPVLPKKHATGTTIVILSGVETSKVLVQVTGTTFDEITFTKNCRVSTATFPSNVKASLNGRLPFWTRPGVLSEKVKLAGLVEDLNVLLKDATSEVPVNLLLTTDTPGVLEAVFSQTSLDISREASARWGGQESIEVPLRAAERKAFAVSFPATQTQEWLISRLQLNLSGRFPPWRAYAGQLGSSASQLGMKVCARFSVARRFDFSQNGELFGFSILVRPQTDSELVLEVAAGKDGQPAAGKSLTTANATVELSAEWIDVLFDSPIEVEANQELWLTLKARKGVIEWSGIGAPAGINTTTLYSDEGGAWQRYPSIGEGKYPVAQMRVLRRPFINENDPLLHISWDTLPEVSLNVTEETKFIEFSRPPGQAQDLAPANDTVVVPLSLTAGASGSITVKNATAFYKLKGVS
jgi:hypothetical protein